MSESEPDWSLARWSPWQFFSLSDEATRSELRRKYAGLIRTYRPESHPEQFIIIRGAFEQLDAILKEKSQEAINKAGESFPPTPPSFEEPTTELHPSHKSSRSKQVVISVCSAEELRATLLAEAASTGIDDFYLLYWSSLTEYITRVGFEDVSSLFRALEHIIDPTTVHNTPWNLSEFYLSILPYLSFTCSMDWLAEKLRFLEVNADLLPADDRLDRLLFLADFQFVEHHYADRDSGSAAAAIRKEVKEKIRSVFGKPHDFNYEALITGHREFSVPDGVYDQICRNTLRKEVGDTLRMWRELLEVATGELVHRHQDSCRLSDDVCCSFVSAIRQKWRSTPEFRRYHWNVTKYQRVTSGMISVICILIACIAAMLSVIPAFFVTTITTPLVILLFGDSTTTTYATIVGATFMVIAFVVCFFLMWRSSHRTISMDEYYWVRNYLQRSSPQITSHLFEIVESEFHSFVRAQNLWSGDLHRVFIDRPSFAAEAWLVLPEMVVDFGRQLSCDPIVRCRMLGNELCSTMNPDMDESTGR